MRNMLFCLLIAAAVMLTGCGGRQADHAAEARVIGISPPTPVTVTATSVPAEKVVSDVSTAAGETESAVTTALKPHSFKKTSEAAATAAPTATTEIITSAEPLQTEPAETVTEEIPEEDVVYDKYYGVLIDEDCSDFEDPPQHDTPCMFMTECRASGYGLDIEQEDGSWVFYMFDENGQSLAWEYLNITERQDGLFVTVTGTWEDNLIKVISIEES